MLSILAPEISSLESQLSQLQARIETLKDAEAICQTAANLVQEALARLGEVAPAMIGAFESKLGELFVSTIELPTQPTDDLDDHDGGCSTPPQEPNQPNDGSGSEEPPAEELNGQSTELVCGLCDAPDYVEKVLREINHLKHGVSIKEPEQPTYEQTTCAEVLEQQPYSEFILLPNENVGYIKKVATGEILATYCGFTSKARATKWGEYLVSRGVASGFELRNAKRMISGFKYELKLSQISLRSAMKLDAKNLKADPTDESQLPQPEVVNDIEPAPAAPAQKYKLIRDTHSGLFVQYLVYEAKLDHKNERYIGKVSQSVGGEWLFQNSGTTFSTPDEAAAALDAKLANDKRIHEEANKAILQRFMDA